jgi:CubicO group peptidase (beta-lactamase class C family)
MIVLHDGDVVFEAYPNMQSYDRHLGWSVTKVVTSTALAVLERQGRVNVDSVVENYLPLLGDSDWAGTSVRDIANMASGMDCRDSDGYQNIESCIYRMEESLGLLARHNPPIDNLVQLGSIKRRRPAGEAHEYVSANTHILGLIIETVTGKPLAGAFKELIWDRIGAEADGLLVTNRGGIAAPHAGLSARLRDIARFGQILTPGANLDVVDDDHMADLRSEHGIRFDDVRRRALADRFADDTPSHAAWQWDLIWPDGIMFKSGYSGQGIFVDP